MTPLAIVILAAGKGTRMPPGLPKVLHPVAGRPLLAHVLATARELSPQRLILVLGHGAEEIERDLDLSGTTVVLQREQRGTGHAVQMAAPALADFGGDLLVLYGDVPLLRSATLQALLEGHRLERNAATVLTADLEDPRGYGRIVRDLYGFCTGIVEQRDLAFDQEQIREINSGIIAFRTPDLLATLTALRPDNGQREYYLTDTIGLLRRRGEAVGACQLADADEIRGVNTAAQLEEVARIHAGRPPAGCPLCAAARQAQAGACPHPETPALILGAGEASVLAVARAPFNNGELLAFPRRHTTRLAGLEAGERAELAAWVQRAEAWLRNAYRCDALNLVYNSGVGGHVALRLVPRWSGDINFLPLAAGLKLVPERPLQTWQHLQAYCGE